MLEPSSKLNRHSGARLFGANPESSTARDLWIPGSPLCGAPE
jgi:hypothetical protein